MQLHTYEWGDPDARPIVCVHGVQAHGRRFRKLAEERLAAQYRVVAPDLRGHGSSSWDPPWNIPTFVEDLVETVDAAGITHADWIGHSFGGRLVMELPARLVERCVLLDPVIQLHPSVAIDRAEEERMERSYATVDEAIRARLESGRLVHTPRELVEEEMRAHLELGDDDRLRPRYLQSAVVAAWGEMASTPADPHPVPTLLVLGAESYLVLPEQEAQLRARLEALLEVVTVPGGHTVLWDAFDATADAIEAFLSRRRS
jgi:lipase